MKYLLVFAVLMVAYWVWRNNRREEQADDESRRTRTPHAPAGQQQMVRCAHCALHLPQSDAVAGRHGWYCGDTHRQLAER